MGYEFEVVKSDVEEVISQELNVKEIPMELSRQKAMDVLDKIKEDVIVIGADTIVALDDEILGKPLDAEDAVKMLKRLSGKRHKVYTGVTLAYKDGEDKVVDSFVCETVVNVSDLSEEEIKAYVDTGDCLDKAGAYGIQGIFAKHIDGIEGDYFNVVGLPVAMLYKNLKKILRKQ